MACGLSERLARHGESIRAAIESMNGARFVHDQLERAGWQVEIADAQKVKGLAPLACKTDRIDAWVLAELSRRELVPAIWLPDPHVRAERERARWRLHLVRHRSSLKQRVHAVLLAHGKPCPVSDLFGVSGRRLLARLALPEPWSSNVEASLRLIDELDREIDSCESELRREPEAQVRVARELVARCRSLTEPARFSVYRWVVRCCRGCGLRSGCVGLPWPVSSCNRCEPDRV
jgi:transposase